jgi:hypothetical protein
MIKNPEQGTNFVFSGPNVCGKRGIDHTHLMFARVELQRLTREAYYTSTNGGPARVSLIASIDGEYRAAYPFARPLSAMPRATRTTPSNPCWPFV